MEPQGPPPPPGSPEPPRPPACPRCGAPHELDQEYCLECGLRLPALGASRTTVRRELWSRDSPAWLWATLVALLLVALVAGAVVAVAASEDEKKGAGKPVVSTNENETTTIGTITDTTPVTLPETGTTATTETIVPTSPTTVSIPTLTTSTFPTTTTATTTTTSGDIRAWPAGKDGYTILLASVPTSRSRARAERKADNAITNGLPDVGLLNSSDYLSLNPGYYVVFTGVYDTLGEAQSDLPTARSFQPLAYVREITP